MKSGQSALNELGSSQLVSGEIRAHSETCTVITSTIDDPNKIISKHAQNQSSSKSGPAACNPNDQCMVITGSKAGDVIVWKYAPTPNTQPQNILQKLTHFYDHDAKVTSIFIHQEMQYFASCSEDGTANMYNLWRLEILRCFQHPELNPLSAVVLSNQPLPCLAVFSTTDRNWLSFSINGQNLKELDEQCAVGQQTAVSPYHEDCAHIVDPKVIQNSYFLERLIYGTEKGQIVIRELPFMNTLKRINISTSNII